MPSTADVAAMNYDFFAPRKIVFGWGRRSELATEVRRLGRRVFVVSGSRSLEQNGTFGTLLDALQQQGCEVVHVATITHEPEVADVDALVADIVQRQPTSQDCLLAIGGGSAIDLAKAAAALVTNRESSTVRDYLEGVGRGFKITAPPLPLVAVPTTAGTGTEATKNAVISSYEPAFKKSLRSDLMVPSVVLIDPELTVTLPPATTAFTGMDAITQLIESYISKRARPIPQALCLQGLTLALPALIEAVENGISRSARTAMSHAALLSGIALANSGLGMAHGVAAGLGVLARVPHGLACAVMLPVTLRTNRDAAGPQLTELGLALWTSLRDLAADHPLRVLVSSTQPTDAGCIELVIELIDALTARLHIPQKLSALGVDEGLIPQLVPASRGNSMDGNSRTLSDSELDVLLRGMI
jgi:alcohol dehydrogenase class IV